MLFVLDRQDWFSHVLAGLRIMRCDVSFVHQPLAPSLAVTLPASSSWPAAVLGLSSELLASSCVPSSGSWCRLFPSGKFSLKFSFKTLCLVFKLRTNSIARIDSSSALTAFFFVAGSTLKNFLVGNHLRRLPCCQNTLGPMPRSPDQ